MKKNITIEQMSTKDKYDYLIGMIESYMDEDANVVSTEQLLEALLIDLINKYPVFSLTDSSVNFYKYPKEFQKGCMNIKKNHRIRKEMIKWLNMTKEEEIRVMFEILNGKPTYSDGEIAFGLALKYNKRK